MSRAEKAKPQKLFKVCDGRGQGKLHCVGAAGSLRVFSAENGSLLKKGDPTGAVVCQQRMHSGMIGETKARMLLVPLFKKFPQAVRPLGFVFVDNPDMSDISLEDH